MKGLPRRFLRRLGLDLIEDPGLRAIGAQDALHTLHYSQLADHAVGGDKSPLTRQGGEPAQGPRSIVNVSRDDERTVFHVVLLQVCSSPGTSGDDGVVLQEVDVRLVPGEDAHQMDKWVLAAPGRRCIAGR